MPYICIVCGREVPAVEATGAESGRPGRCAECGGDVVLE